MIKFKAFLIKLFNDFFISLSSLLRNTRKLIFPSIPREKKQRREANRITLRKILHARFSRDILH